MSYVSRPCKNPHCGNGQKVPHDQIRDYDEKLDKMVGRWQCRNCGTHTPVVRRKPSPEKLAKQAKMNELIKKLLEEGSAMSGIEKKLSKTFAAIPSPHTPLIKRIDRLIERHAAHVDHLKELRRKLKSGEISAPDVHMVGVIEKHHEGHPLNKILDAKPKPAAPKPAAPSSDKDDKDAEAKDEKGDKDEKKDKPKKEESNNHLSLSPEQRVMLKRVERNGGGVEFSPATDPMDTPPKLDD